MAKAKNKAPHSTATKEELERKKIELEIKDLERPFWKRPVYVLAALPTLLAVATLLVGLFNGYFSAALIKLENQKHDVEAQIKDFEAKRDELHSENERLKTEKESLETKIAELNQTTQGRIITLEKKRLELEVANSTLSQQNNSLSTRKKETESELGRINKDLEDLYTYTGTIISVADRLEASDLKNPESLDSTAKLVKSLQTSLEKWKLLALANRLRLMKIKGLQKEIEKKLGRKKH